MAEFAIVRQDGEVDKVSGLSVQDVADQYGWPGNGEIVPWDSPNHSSHLRHSFASPAEQRETLADKPKSKVKAGDAPKTPDAPVVMPFQAVEPIQVVAPFKPKGK